MKRILLVGAISRFQKIKFIVALLMLLLMMQGCGATVYRGVTPAEADVIVANLAGTTKPADVTLAKYYQEEQKYISWRGTWNCNNQLVKVMLINQVLTPGNGNFVEGQRSSVGDSRCTSIETHNMAGRYDKNYLYLYIRGVEQTFIEKYAINKKAYWADEMQVVEGALVFLGQYKYIDDVWSFHKAKANPLYGVSGQKIPESGGWADMWESSELAPKKEDPRLSAEERRLAIVAKEGKKVGELAAEIAAREAEYDADQRAADKAANAQALNAVMQKLAADNAYLQAESAKVMQQNLHRLQRNERSEQRNSEITQSNVTESSMANYNSSNSQVKPVVNKQRIATDPNPYKNDSFNWRDVGFAISTTRQGACQEAKAQASSEISRLKSVDNPPIITAESPCVCFDNFLAYGKVDDGTITCHVYIKTENPKRSGPANSVAR